MIVAVALGVAFGTIVASVCSLSRLNRFTRGLAVVHWWTVQGWLATCDRDDDKATTAAHEARKIQDALVDEFPVWAKAHGIRRPTEVQ